MARINSNITPKNISARHRDTWSNHVLIISHIRMDVPETQNSLDCDGHAALFPNWNHQIKESPTGGVGTVSSKTQRTTQTSEVWKKLKPSTFHPLLHVKIPLPQEGFPPQIPRPRPRPFPSKKPVLGTPKKFKAIPSTYFCASGISCDRPNMAKLAKEIKKLRFKSRDINVLKLSHEFTSEWRL